MIVWRLSPFEHQQRAALFARGREYYALLMEQGTGKSAVVVHDAADRWVCGELELLVVVAPNGVHTNWVLNEIPTHMPEGVRYVAADYHSSMLKAEREAVERVVHAPSGVLRILTVAWDALNTAACKQLLDLLFNAAPRGKTMLVADESQRAKSPKALRTKALLSYAHGANVRAILSGTAILNSPWDAFSQFGFLHPSILRTTSYTAFKAEYAHLLPPGSGLFRHVAERQRIKAEALYRNTPEPRRTQLVNAYLAKYGPQLVARDSEGNPRWRNLERLEGLIAPHSFRVLKKDCLDLPEKVYQQTYYRMTAKQREAYVRMKEELRAQLEDGRIAPVERIAALTKLSQIVSGYLIIPGTQGEVQRLMPVEDNPKLAALEELLEDRAEQQVIVWARFRHELNDIATLLRKLEVPFVEYHGGVPRGERREAMSAFERGAVRVFVGQQRAGGTGLTLVAPNSMARAMSVIYFSNTFSLEDRLQSEDRAHRIGQTKSVVYCDMVCRETIDERIMSSLRSKVDLAQTVLGDKRAALELLR